MVDVGSSAEGPRVRRDVAVLCAVLLAAASSVWCSTGPDAPSDGAILAPGVDPLPRPAVPEAMATNIDFVTRGLFGPAGWHAIAYNASKQHVYIGLRHSFTIYNVSDPARPSLVGWLEVDAQIYQDGITDLVYPGSGNLVYGTAEGDLVVFDVTSPSAPVVRGRLGLSGARFLAVSGSHAYLSAGPAGVIVADLSNPASPSVVGAYHAPTGLLGDISVLGSYVYFTVMPDLFSFPEVWILDVSVPSAPTLAGSLSGGGANFEALATTASPPRLFVTDTSFGLYVFDLTNPAVPLYLGAAANAGYGQDVQVAGPYAYTPTTLGFDVVDASNPLNPTLAGRYTGFPSYGSPSGVAVTNGYAFVAAGRAGLQVMDVVPASQPSVVAAVEAPGDARDVSVSGGLAYYVSAGQGLFIVDVSVLERPKLVGKFLAPNGRVVQVRDKIAYFGDGSGLKMIDVTDPHAPSQLGGLATGAVNHLHVVGNLAYVAAGTAGVKIVDVSVPSAPVLVGTYDSPGSAWDVKVAGKRAFVADYTSGFEVVDVTNPAAPALLGTYSTYWEAVAVDFSGRYAYVAEGGGRRVQILDVSDPASPVWMADIPTPDDAQDVRVVGNLAYITCRYGGLRVVDVSIPWAPVEVGSYVTNEPSWNLGFQGGYVFLSESDGGGPIVHYRDQCFDDFEPNDEVAKAWPVAAGATIEPKICGVADVDFFEIRVGEGGTLDVTMQPPPGKDYNLFLYDPAGALVGSSTSAGDATEHVVRTVASGGTYAAKVVGNAGDSDGARPYTFYYSFTPCPTPAHAVYIYTMSIDVNGNVVLHIQDPNQPATRTGYNIYRATAPQGPFTLRASNVVDMDQGQPNIQYTDVDSSGGGSYYYRVTAYNGNCGAEGPQ
ncbi:MAG: hypothetical protein LAO51_15885 [Acidobacteriia bacterium]|nr:hypothetical protein [Terriglobia bacterium]